jgi:prepilin-type N-terminal cleavage/methylation domain-containing protein|tara:strand:- start:2004 stop:2462 length:459 start_codon:yes stop_codon:yes gene_type:complete
MNIKFKAFTLVEILVTMAISAVVMAFSYQCLTYINQYFNQTKNTQHMLSECVRLQSFLYRDFDSAEAILFEENELSIVGKKAIYQFGEFPVRIKGIVNDTFKLKVLNDRTVVGLYDSNLVHHLHLECMLLKDTLVLEFNKTYTSKIKMAYEK